MSALVAPEGVSQEDFDASVKVVRSAVADVCLKQGVKLLLSPVSGDYEAGFLDLAHPIAEAVGMTPPPRRTAPRV